MSVNKFFNENYGCSISIGENDQLIFELRNKKVPMTGFKFPGTDIQSIQPNNVKNRMMIEGVFIPYGAYVSFTGLLDDYGLVDINLKQVS